MSEARSIWNGQATLGEGPIWDPAREVLWFVDIKQHTVHQLDAEGGDARSWQAPAQVGWVIPAADGRLVAGLQTGLAVFDPRDGSFTPLAEVEADLPTNRLNDATVGADGAIWFGSMDDNEKDRTGRFYRWDGQQVTPLAIDPVRITNGPALSPDGATLYCVDTVGSVIHAVSLDADGQVAATRPFAVVDPKHGHPDGCSVDSAGNVWLGLWGGWRARLYSPAGEVLREVWLPASNVTKVALGGPDLKTAFVTTARAGLSDAQLAEQPEAGNVFAFDVDIPGIAAAPAAI